MNPPPITTVTPAQILRNGYEQAVRHDAPADVLSASLTEPNLPREPRGSEPLATKSND